MDDRSKKSSIATDKSNKTSGSAQEAARVQQLANKHSVQPPIPNIDDEAFNIDDCDDDYENGDTDSNDEYEEDDNDDQFMDDDDDLIEVDNKKNYDSNQNRTNVMNIDNPSTSLPENSSLTAQCKNLSSSQRNNTNVLMSTAKRKNDSNDEEFKFEVLTPEKIVQTMVETIKEVNQVVELPPTITRILLHHFRWDKEKLMERFYDGNQDKLFKEAHVVNPFKIKLSSQSSITSAASTSSKNKVKEYDCNICFLGYPEKEMASLECMHKFCKDCWRVYLKTKIIDEGMGLSISCAAHKCDILVDDSTVMSLVEDPAVKNKYQHLITNSYVEFNRLMRWCPAPDCNNVIKAVYFDAQPVQCACEHLFCFGCGENWHDPVRCRWLRKWIKKCDDDSETSNWIAANTKECPKCHVTIEKNGGCNHIICKNQACRAEFCWVCCGAWEPHGSSWYNCNRFNEDDAKKARDNQEKSRSMLQRYLHYCNRYMNHHHSLKLELKLDNSIREKMEEMQQHNMSWIEVQFLRKAVDVLCLCRQTLMYTYAFAFYLKKNNHSIIFEDNQADLEIAVEKLSGYLERDITSDNAIDIKQQVQDKYRYCEHRRNVLLDHVHEGYDREYWEYQDDL